MDMPTTTQPLTLGQLREHRRALLWEAQRAARWRRLVQARLDMAVASAVPVDDLAHPEAGLDSPDADALRRVLEGRDDVPTCQELLELRSLHQALVRYAKGVEALAAEATSELVHRLTEEPRRCLGKTPDPIVIMQGRHVA